MNNGRSKWSALSSIVCIAVALQIPGCKGHRYTTTEDWTKYRLWQWASALQDRAAAGRPVAHYKSLAEFSAFYAEVFDITSKGQEHQLKDDWKRPIRWSVLVSGKTTTIRLTSDGSNGLPEEGRGDDIFVEVRIHEGSKVELHRSWK